MKYFLYIFLSLLLFNTGIYKVSYAKKSEEPSYSKSAVLVVNSVTGKVIYKKNAGKHRYPASLTKMMTLYILFDHLQQKNISMEQDFKISHHAEAQPRSKIYLKAGEKISVKDLVLSLIVKSANDSAVVVAEAISGSEDRFAEYMTGVAVDRLGMKNTVFKNASGLYDKDQKTTAYDIARLAISIERDFPEYYPLFKKHEFFYKGKKYESHNRVVKNYEGADGLKTGYINASGFNIAVSAHKGSNKLITVVMGEDTYKKRDKYVIKLLDSVFYNLLKKENNYHIPVAKPHLSRNMFSLISETEKILEIKDYSSCGVGTPIPKLKVAYLKAKEIEEDVLENISYVFAGIVNHIPKLKISLFHLSDFNFPRLRSEYSKVSLNF